MRILTFGAAMTFAAVAQPTLAECSGLLCSDVQISYLYTDSDGASWISTTGTETYLDCTPDSGNLIKVDPAKPQANWLYSAIMMAYVTNQKVTVRVNPGGTCAAVYMFMGTR